MPPNVHHAALAAASASADAAASAGEVETEASRPDDADGSTTTIAAPSSLPSDASAPYDADVEEEEEYWSCPASAKSLRTVNPIRDIVDPIVSGGVESGRDRGDGKDRISLALGDPTAYGNFPPCPSALTSVSAALALPGSCAGYVNACGTPESRSAIAKRHSNPSLGLPVSPDDVIVASGCSGALELALTALLDVGTVVLVPNPGFPLYEVIAKSHGAGALGYDLTGPEFGWECDLEHAEGLIMEAEGWDDGDDGDGDGDGDDAAPPAAGGARGGKSNGGEEVKARPGDTGGPRSRSRSRRTCRVVRAMVINNPSNPTGSVYSSSHLRRILSLARKYRIPVVSDEIYGDLTYGDAVFRPLADVAFEMGGNVPIITAGGLGKRFLVPGWRVGWIVFHDSRNGALRNVKAGARSLAQVTLGASHLSQSAVPPLLDPSAPRDRLALREWMDDLRAELEGKAASVYDGLRSCVGLEVTEPRGAMYAMVAFEPDSYDDEVVDDVAFAGLLLREENVFVLPGSAFGPTSGGGRGGVRRRRRSFFRVVFCAPEEVLVEAIDRIRDFCERHVRA